LISEKHHIAIKDFFAKYAAKICDGKPRKKSFAQLDQFPLFPSQAIYVSDMQEMKIVYQRGIKRLLGYTKNEFTFDLLMHCYHPDDIGRYRQIVEKSNSFIRQNKPDPFTLEATYNYRIKMKDGTYLKVLRQSTVFDVTNDHLMRSSFSVLSDISFIKQDNSVNLSIIYLNTGGIVLDDNMKIIGPMSFTNREKEILSKIKQGLSSSEIADEINRSRHTIDTIRRNMLRKTGCKNTIELINLCSMQGIL